MNYIDSETFHEDSLAIIYNMKKVSEYYNKWRAIREYYKKILDGGPKKTEINYVTHNYETHCINIYENLEYIVHKTGPGELTPSELLILNVAVILHDYTMIQNNARRKIHSKDAKDYILNMANSMDNNPLHFISHDFLRYIAWVVYAHSDVIDEDGEKIWTLKSIADIFKKQETSLQIRYFYLGAMLRLADELDCTIKRIQIPVTNYYFSDSKEDVNSFNHHLKHYFIEKVRKDNKYNDVLVLETNDIFIKNYGDLEKAKKIIDATRKKIRFELDQIYENIYRVFDEERYPCPMKLYRHVCIKSELYPELWENE